MAYPYFTPNYQPYHFQQPQYQQPQMMTPPTIHAEIVQVDGENAVDAFPLAGGASQMMMARDDSFIAIKSMAANGQASTVYFDRRPAEPEKPPLDLSVYVRKDELPGLLAAMKGDKNEPVSRLASETE